jgi:nitrogen fixation protein FixH
MVFTCMGYNSELEYKDYYARELKFQEQVDAVNNEAGLAVPIDHRVNGREVEIILPAEIMTDHISGTVQFLRPSNALLDKTIALNPGADGRQKIDAGLSGGVYKMSVLCEAGGKKYYKEAVINLK